MTFGFNDEGLIETVRAEARGRMVGDTVVPTPGRPLRSTPRATACAFPMAKCLILPRPRTLLARAYHQGRL